MRNIYPLNSRFTLPFAFVLAASLLAVSLMFMLPGGLLHAQTGPIEYPENGTGAVATFTAIDPEGESITWTLAGNDAAEFDIENGVLRFKSPPDYEDTNNTGHMYAVTVQASDGGADTTATEAVTVEITNVEEAGMIMLSTLQPQVGVAITATLTDGDGIGADNLASISWQWYRGNSPIAGGTNGEGAIMSVYTPAAGDIGSVLSAKAMYDDDEGDDKTAEQDSAHASREAPTSNVPPTFPMLVGGTGTNQTREVAENTPAGTNIGAPVTASDTDVLTYSLDGTGADASSFDINRATGHLITKAPLDYEDPNNNDQLFTVNVIATDPFGALTMAQVTIMVTDVNEAPELAGVVSIDLAEDITDLDDSDTSTVREGQYTVTDEDTDDDVGDDADIKWSLSGADSSKFQLTTTGATRTLSFKEAEAPNFESPGDSGANNVYEVTVVVTDTKSNTDELAVMVKVTNIEEDGAITFSTLQPRVGFPVTATLTDPDNVNADSLEWQWYRSDSFTEDNIPTAECAADNSDECLIKDATSGTYRPTAGDAEERLTAVASYTDGHANADDAKDMVIAQGATDVLTSTVNQAPVFPDEDNEMEGRQTAQTREVAENTAAGENIGVRVVAMDEDANLTYSLGGPDAASFDIDRGAIPAMAGQLKTKSALDKETKDTYTVTVTATDSLSLSSTITVTIKVTDVDEMPDLEGEAPEEYAENGTGAVATFTAVDPEGESITWTVTGTDNDAFSIENGVLRFRSPPDFEGAGDNTYVVTVEASDRGAAETATKEVSIDITNVEEPGTVTLSTLQPQVDRDIMATLDDPDNEEANTVTWQWYRGNSLISGATNATVNNGMATSTYTPDAGDVGSVLRATAMYDDAEGDDKTARDESFRSVRSAPSGNSAPAFPDQIPATQAIDKTQTREVAENTPAGTNLGAPVAAEDRGDVLTYSLGGTNPESFDIVRSSGQIRTKAALDFETTPSYIVTVTATDPSGTSDTATVNIALTDVNEVPTFTDGAAASLSHEEGTTVLDTNTTTDNVDPAAYTASDADMIAGASESLKWSLSGADASKFSITDSGDTRTLSFEEAPDYESPGDSGANNVYEVTVVVTDTKRNTAEHSVTVKVTNMEEDGVITLSTLQPRVSFPVTATLADPDNITAGSVSWQWYKGTVTVSDFATIGECDDDANTDNCAIKDATSDTYTPVTGDTDTTDVGDILSAVATYIDGSPNIPAVNDGKDVVVQPAAQQVLADTGNKAPEFPDQDTEMDGDQTDQERSVLENVPVIGGEPATVAIRPVGAAVTAMDDITADDGGTTLEILTYSLGGPDAASFTIDRGTAHISTKADVALDTETKDTYTVTVTATDPSSLTATITVTIKVTGVDEAPTIMRGGLAISGQRSVSYAEKGTGAVATYTVVGPESASTTWSVSGEDAGDFNITTGGDLRFNASPDYDAPRDADTNNVYKVTVEAYDGTFMDTLDVTVMVTDDGEVTPTISGPDNPPYAENSAGPVATYMLSANAASAAWTLEGPDADDFTIDSGVLVFKLPPDYERKATYMITVKADGATYDVTITVTDVDEALTAISGPSDVDYAENGTDDVATFAAMDPDGTAISWTLEGTDADVFDISNGGVLTFKSPPDYETKTNYTVTVKATAGTDMATPHQVTVTVTDVNEALTAISGPSNTDYAENRTDDVATFISMDPEGATISWTLEGTDADVFDISSGGVLTFRSSPDYEMAADANTDNIYMITVNASDGTYMATPHQVTIMVTDVSEMVPEMSLLDRYDTDGNDQIDKSEVLTAISDYFNQVGGLTKPEVLEIIRLYFNR